MKIEVYLFRKVCLTTLKIQSKILENVSIEKGLY